MIATKDMLIRGQDTKMKSHPRSAISTFAGKVTELLARTIADRTKMLVLAAVAIAALAVFVVVKAITVRGFQYEVIRRVNRSRIEDDGLIVSADITGE